MKVIGLIGGMSWNSTAEYYRLINGGVAKKLGGFHSARLILYSLDFDEVEQTQRQARWGDAAEILIEASNAVKGAGADFLVICTNTMHKVADAVTERVGLPLIHIVDVTGNAIIKNGLRKVGLLGTRFVMEESFYRGKLEEQFGIQVLLPNKSDREVIDRIIYDKLCQGVIEASSRYTLIETIRKLIGQGAEGIILGCTELPLLIQPGDIDIPLFNTTHLHAEAAVNLALAEE